MKRLLGTLTLLTMTAAMVMIPATASRASWSSDNCNEGQWADAYIRRKDAKAYANVARYEGYSWGGSCWNDDNRDNSPDEQKGEYTGGEGPDCSGLVFKTWELQFNGGAGTTYHDKLQLGHGQYVADDFHSPNDWQPFYRITKDYATTAYMDVFASTGHVALIWTDSNPGDGTDVMAEAKGEDYGTGTFVETYRYSTLYTAARRVNWTPDCYPNCGAPRQGPVVVP
jgi:hypothetical protein